MITMKVVLIHHMLDQSRILTDLLKDIETMDKPNVEVFLNILRLYQKMQGSQGGPKRTVNNVNAGNNDGKKNNSQKGVGGCKCIVSCTENHPLWQCDVYKNKSSAEKQEVVQKYNCCLNCLQEGHSVDSCSSEWV